MKAILKIALITLIITFHLAYSTYINKETIYFNILENGDVMTNVTLHYNEITTSNLSYFFMGDIKLLSYKLDNISTNCSNYPVSLGSEISCYKDDLTKNFTANFLFLTRLVLNKQNYYVFSYDLPIIYPTDHVDIYLLLPEGGVVAKSNIIKTIQPENYEIGSDKEGRRFKIHWKIDKPQLGKTYRFITYYEVKSSLSNPIKNINHIKNNYIMIISITLSILLMSLLIYTLIVYRKKHKEKVIEILIEDEKKVIDAIKELGQGCKQKDVVRFTGFSKAKVSRIIEELKKRNIISVERVGKHNKLYLKN